MYGVEEEAVFDLLEVFEKHLDNQDVMREVYNHYEPVISFLPPTVSKALEFLYTLAYPESDSKIEKPTKEDIKLLKTELKEEGRKFLGGKK